MSAVVSDSSPLNYLALLSDFDLLRIYRTVIIPPAVYHEVVESGADFPVSKAVQAALGNWIFVAEAPSAEQVAIVLGSLDRCPHLGQTLDHSRLAPRWMSNVLAVPVAWAPVVRQNSVGIGLNVTYQLAR